MMSTEDREFEHTVRNVEQFARLNPRRYAISVAVLAWLPHIYIVAVLVAALAMLGMLVSGTFWVVTDLQQSVPGAGGSVARLFVPLLIGLGVLIGAMLKALWIVIPPPSGPELTRETATRLNTFLDEISTALHAPKLDHVLLSEVFDAGVVRVPRFGMIGPSRNYLIVGLPLMKALSRDQFRAVIAREMGHLSQTHSRFAGWIYVQRETWLRIATHVERNWIFTPFLKWYAPYFYAQTFALARADETVADKCAVEVAGAQFTAETLVAVELQRRYLDDRIWPAVMEPVKDHPHPVGTPFTSMFKYDRFPPLTAYEATSWLLEAWLVASRPEESHPSLCERLSALGFRGLAGSALEPPKPPFPPPVQARRSAAEDLLGPSCDTLTAVMDAEWRRGIRDVWSEKHNEALSLRQRREVLEEIEDTRGLSMEEGVEYVELVERFDGARAAVANAKMLARSFPRSSQALSLAGMVMLRAGDAGGIQLLETATKFDSTLRPSIQSTIVDFLRTQGKWAEAHRYHIDPPKATKAQ
ncbi:MAG: M48 family metallopeptidase [Capsulimonadaceae bacterium]